MSTRRSHSTTSNIVTTPAGDIHELSYNLWWSWNPPAQRLFQQLSPLAWEATNHNPVAVLAQLSDDELIARLGDPLFRKELKEVMKSFRRYMAGRPQRGKKAKKGIIAYFCAEFGFHECLPFYSGGLGVLAGDHSKSASDLGLPFIGVGLFYRQGYFQQKIDAMGAQQEQYPHTNPALVPVDLVKNRDETPVLCSVHIGSNEVFFQSWRIQVGRSQIYLIDTDVPNNEEHLRGLTGLAYGGDVTLRIRQEILLGIGGVRLLRSMGITPHVYHMNEGHAAFLTIELLCEQVQRGVSLRKAEENVRNRCIFTTHTPVPAGHDRFPHDLFAFTMHPYAEALKMPVETLMNYGRVPQYDDQSMFTMTVLGLKLSRAANGVSRKHGQVSREMWKNLYGLQSDKNVPIDYITNGVHVPSWASPTSWSFWSRHGGDRWPDMLMEKSFWKKITDHKEISDEELWALRYELRREMIDFIRQRMREHFLFSGASTDESYQHLLSPDALTIGYARRFAQYKRAPLIFRDLQKVEEIFGDPEHPVQIIYAGKAHPRDEGGKHFIQQIVEMTRHPHFYGKVVFLENYDMNVARHLVSGCDIWLNNPRKPLEASGTSGQKIAINGGLHASILDGWWDEAFNGSNGWAIDGVGALPTDVEDQHDAESLYSLLRNEIIPLFYDRDERGLPVKWLGKIRAAMRTIIPVYNTSRMVNEYADKYYYIKSR